MYAAFRMSALEELPDVGEDLEVKLSGCLLDAPATGVSSCDERTTELRGRTTTAYSVLAVFPLSQCNQHARDVRRPNKRTRPRVRRRLRNWRAVPYGRL